MAHKIKRRTALGLLAGSIVVGGCATGKSESVSQRKSKLFAKSHFLHGVASGDPDHHSVVLWTRVSNVAESVAVQWQLASDPDFKKLLQQGTVLTDAERDYTVKVVPQSLSSGESFYYRFKIAEDYSPIGRTKTLPVGAVDTYGLALVSCSNYAFGFFNAYQAIADDPQIDLVLHTGDYIYEYGADGWGAETAKQLNRVHQPAHEIVSLADYRQRHAQYKLDSGSQAMHAAHPMVCCWDDHESTNNPWMHGAQNHQAEQEGSWSQRRAASVQAYYEWMPIRDRDSDAERLKISKRYQIGELASLVTLESRHTARAEQIDYFKYVESIQSQQDARIFKKDVIGAPGREMISTQTEDLLLQSFADASVPWRLVGNASPIARMLVPDVAALGVLQGERAEHLETLAAKGLIWKGKYNLPFYTDTWDGYPWARERLYQRCQQANLRDMLFLTGDSHSFWFNQLADNQGQQIGLELGTAGVSSPGDFVESGWSLPIAEKLDRVFEQQLPEVLWTDNFHQGFVKLMFTPRVAQAEFVAVSTVLEKQFTVSTIKTAKIMNAEHQLHTILS